MDEPLLCRLVAGEALPASRALPAWPPAPPDRPLVLANMVSSIDGRATVAGRSSALSGPADRRLFHALREAVDAVLVGARTVQDERYGRMVSDPATRERRTGAGRCAEPLACVWSRSVDLSPELPLLACPQSRVLVITPSERELPAVGARVGYLRTGSLAQALGRLRSEHAIATVLCEGGPTLLSALAAEGLLDELFLTVSPVLVGGGGNLSILGEQPLGAPRPGRLVGLLEHESALFARYCF